MNKTFLIKDKEQTRVFIDGVEIVGLTAVKTDFAVNEIDKVTLTYYTKLETMEKEKQNA